MADFIAAIPQQRIANLCTIRHIADASSPHIGYTNTSRPKSTYSGDNDVRKDRLMYGWLRPGA